MDPDLLPLLIGGGLVFLIAAAVILSRSWGDFGKPPTLPSDPQPPRADGQWGQQWEQPTQQRTDAYERPAQQQTFSTPSDTFGTPGELLPIDSPQLRQNIEQMMRGPQRQRYERYLLVDQGRLYLRLDQVQPEYRQQVIEIMQQLNSGGIATANPLTMIKLMTVLARAFR